METRDIQKKCLVILEEFVRICEKYNIAYYLVGGTTLGAVRHKGFIPWDDDIDVGILRKDYNKFLNVCKTELSSEFYLQYFENESMVVFPYAKIRLNNTMVIEKEVEHLNIHHGIFIDIFPLDNAPDSRLLRLIQKKGIRLCDVIKASKLGVTNKSRLKNCLLKVFRVLIPNAFLIEMYNFFFLLANNKQTKFIGNLVGFYPYEKEMMDKSIFGEGIYLEFEGLMCRVPSEIDLFLKNIYGENYMEIPPIEDRKDHSYVYVKL